MAKHERPTISPALKDQLKSLTFDEQRVVIGIFLKNPGGGNLWDLLTGLRGPDSPSETPDMSSSESAKAYQGRRDRKYKSTEVIREEAFFGVVGGAARYRKATKVLLPPQSLWDHFDKHAYRAANAIGLKVEYESKD